MTIITFKLILIIAVFTELYWILDYNHTIIIIIIQIQHGRTRNEKVPTSNYELESLFRGWKSDMLVVNL